MDVVAERRVHLGCFPTPLHRHRGLEGLLGLDELWLKRDDLSGFGWGGNKVRTAEYLLGDALDNGATAIVLASGPSSNFAATMTAAAVGAGLAVEHICYGAEPVRTPMALRVTRALGATVLFTGSQERSSMDELAAVRAEAITTTGGIAYSIPRGGATPVGSLGFAAAAVELERQLTELGVETPTVVIAVGSGGSIAGLATGRDIVGAGWKITGVSVSRPIDQIGRTVAAHTKLCAALLPTSGDGKAPPVDMADGRGYGFGRSRPSETELAARIERVSGLLLDPVYTAKAARWLADADLDGPVVFWHTGGALGVADRLLS